jgi:hypothetical protein
MIEEHIVRIFKVKEGYAAHNYCDSHCHHKYWYQHAGYYYYEYREPRYENRASRTTVNTNRSECTSGEIRSFSVI